MNANKTKKIKEKEEKPKVPFFKIGKPQVYKPTLRNWIWFVFWSICCVG